MELKVVEILDKIKEKKAELNGLNNLLKQASLNEYSYLIGKYYKLAATSCIYIESLGYVGDGYVNVNCINIQGGKYDGGKLKINQTDDYEFRIIDIPRLTEITKEKFLEFLDEAIGKSKQVTIELLP